MKTYACIPFLLAFYSVYGELQCAKEGSSRSPSLKIKNKILCNYDKEYRPVKDLKRAVNVSIRLIPKYLDSISDEDATIDVQNWLGVVWKDEFLTWNPSDYDSIKNIHVSSDEIWTPDLRLYKESESKDSLFESASCLVTNTGFVSCVLENEHLAYCTTNAHKWPFETRTCELVYTTGIYNSSEIKISKTKLGKGSLQPNPGWELINSTNQVVLKRKAGQTYHYIKFYFTIKRHSARTTSIIIVPALSLITMTLVPLWMHPSNTERFCLIAANILSHFLFMQHLGWIAPTKGNKLPAAVTFFRDSLGLAIAVLIELTLVKSLLGGKTASPTWLVKPCKLVASGTIGKVLISENVQEIKDEEGSTQSENKELTTKKMQEERLLIVTVLDRILFFALSVAYFVLVMLLIPFN